MHTLQREALRLGPIAVDPPVVLAPMAGITNAAYQQLCREQGAGLYVCEMITSRAVVERIPKTFAMLRFDPGETVRSVLGPPIAWLPNGNSLGAKSSLGCALMYGHKRSRLKPASNAPPRYCSRSCRRSVTPAPTRA